MNFFDIDQNYITKISGIGKGSLSSLGLTFFEMRTCNFITPHNFHIVENNFLISDDGIIEIDFMKKFNSQLDFNTVSDKQRWPIN